MSHKTQSVQMEKQITTRKERKEKPTLVVTCHATYHFPPLLQRAFLLHTLSHFHIVTQDQYTGKRKTLCT